MSSSYKPSVQDASIKDILKQRDAFLTTSERVYEYVSKHLRPILIGAAVLAAALVTVLAVTHYRAAREREALAAFDQAWALFEAGDPAKTIEAMDRVRVDFAGRPASRLATMALVGLYADSGRHDQALPLAEELLKTVNEPALKVNLLYSVGVLAEAVGDLEKAAQSLQAALLEATGDFKLRTLVALGRVEEARGAKEAAVTAYETAANEFPASLEAYQARYRLTLLQAPPAPAEPVAPAPAEPVEPTPAEPDLPIVEEDID